MICIKFYYKKKKVNKTGVKNKVHKKKKEPRIGGHTCHGLFVVQNMSVSLSWNTCILPCLILVRDLYLSFTQCFFSIAF